MQALQSPLKEGCVERCPACRHRGLTAGESEAQKLAWVRRALARFEKAVEPVRAVRDDERWGYRHKATLRALCREGRWQFGVLVPSRAPEARPYDTELIAIPACPVHSPEVRDALAWLSQTLTADLPLFAASVAGGWVTLVLKCAPDPAWTERLRELEAGAPLGVKGLYLNFHASAGNRVFSSKGWSRVFGPERLFSPMTGLAYGPDTFQQQIGPLYLGALEEACAFLAPDPFSAVLDLCSGVGASLRLWQAAGACTLGVELQGAAVQCAELNVGAPLCLQGKASERLPQIESWRAAQGGRRFLCFANPPRTGLEPEVCEYLRQPNRARRPERIAYLSCSMGTLARDLSILADAEYSVERVIPYDFFPQTDHIEALALLRLA